MSADDFETGMKTEISIKPEHSQTYVVTLAILSGICLIAGFFFLAQGLSFSWLPFLFTIIFFVASFICWNKSHKNIDLANSVPTKITNTKTGLELTTDTRALASPEILSRLEKILTYITHTEPLPDPDGLIDRSGIPIPGSRAAAAKIVHQANESAEKITKEAIIVLSGRKDVQVFEQPAIQIESDEILRNIEVIDETS